ncbi:DUF5808 domain-containing protein [Nesterenkonia sphaerica]|nr:DUF5808 domain-containing protein [Nesterenkonia sphaerica]
MSAQRGNRKRGRPGVFRLLMAGLTVAAVAKELRKEPDERTWNGQVAGFVPYDFRMPTLERVKERMWDPEGDHLISPHVFGVGWTVNLGRVVALAKRRGDAH